MLRVLTRIYETQSKSVYLLSSQKKWENYSEIEKRQVLALALSRAFSYYNILENMDLFHNDVQDELLIFEVRILPKVRNSFFSILKQISLNGKRLNNGRLL